MKNIYWLTGLPCSGKSTIGKELARRLYAPLLDGNMLRTVSGNNDFSVEGRTRHMQFVGYIANMMSTYTDVVVSLASPLRDVREELKKMYPNLYEIYVKCSLAVCQQRDVKGQYSQALQGKIEHFTGVQDSYEEPLQPHITVETDKECLEDCVKKILQLKDFKRKALIIGRWQPLHEGHHWLVEKVTERGYGVILGIRQTPINKANPFSVEERISMIRTMFGNSVDVLVLPDIAGIFYGRNVGYIVEELKPPEDIAKISATKIRGIKNDRKYTVNSAIER